MYEINHLYVLYVPFRQGHSKNVSIQSYILLVMKLYLQATRLFLQFTKSYFQLNYILAVIFCNHMVNLVKLCSPPSSLLSSGENCNMYFMGLTFLFSDEIFHCFVCNETNLDDCNAFGVYKPCVGPSVS